jgi:hypothetical protein
MFKIPFQPHPRVFILSAVLLSYIRAWYASTLILTCVLEPVFSRYSYGDLNKNEFGGTYSTNGIKRNRSNE